MRKSIFLLVALALAASSIRAETAVEKGGSKDLDQKAETAAVESSAAPSEAEPEYKPPKGFKKKTTNGKTVYCRPQKVIGTRFAKTFCYTQMQLEQLEEQNELVRRNVAISQQQGPAPNGG
jgi:hypothetical protein